MSSFNYGDSVILTENVGDLEKGIQGFVRDGRGAVVYVNFGDQGMHFVSQAFLRLAHNPNQQEIDFENKNTNI